VKLEPDALVKWVGEDGGWKVGRTFSCEGAGVMSGDDYLVRHSHTGELEWVDVFCLSRYPMREEWEAKS
jgi:hypothetical protein